MVNGSEGPIIGGQNSKEFYITLGKQALESLGEASPETRPAFASAAKDALVNSTNYPNDKMELEIVSSMLRWTLEARYKDKTIEEVISDAVALPDRFTPADYIDKMNICLFVQKKFGDKANLYLLKAGIASCGIRRFPDLAGLETFGKSLNNNLDREPKGKTTPIRTKDGRTLNRDERLGGGDFSEVYSDNSDKEQPLVVKVYDVSTPSAIIIDEAADLKGLEEYQRAHNLLDDGKMLTPSLKYQGESTFREPIIVMTRMTGSSLREVFPSHQMNHRAILQEEALLIGERVCRVFEALHEGLGKSFYDFQPGNIFLDRQKGTVGVVDFNFLSGRKLHNGSVAEFNPDSDIFAFGKLLFRLVTASSFDKNSPVATQLEGLSIAPDIKKILSEVLAFDPENRLKNARRLREEIAGILTRI